MATYIGEHTKNTTYFLASLIDWLYAVGLYRGRISPMQPHDLGAAGTLAVWVYSGAPRCEELFQLRIIHLYQVTLR